LRKDLVDARGRVTRQASRWSKRAGPGPQSFVNRFAPAYWAQNCWESNISQTRIGGGSQNQMTGPPSEQRIQVNVW